MITKKLLENSIKEHENFMQMVCENKYSHKNYEDVVNNVINYCNITDTKQQNLLRSGKFISGGSTLAKCNTDTKGSFSNCYVDRIYRDSIEEIYDCKKRLARTFSMRGGVGFSITVLRPKGCPVNNAAKTSSGAVSFLPEFSVTGDVIGTEGRRAAMICLMDIRHPDIIDFINCKSYPEKVFQKDIFTQRYPDISSINISVAIPDSFMTAVKNNEDWALVFPDIDADKDLYNKEWDGDYDKWYKIGGKFKVYDEIPARKLLQLISTSAHVSGDPGVWFIDHAQQNTFTTHIDESLKPIATNPCFHEDTLIPTINGTFKIKDLVGKTVKVFDGKNWVECNNFQVTGKNQKLLCITTADGEQISVTPYHNMILSADQKKKAKDISVGDKLKSIFYNKEYVVTDITEVKGLHTVYCCNIPTTHQILLANGIITGQCGELPLADKNSCLLGAFVLHKYVKDNNFDFTTFEKDVRTATQIMNIFSDINENLHPLQEQRDIDKFSKRLGIEFTGAGDMLSMLGIKYGSEDSCKLMKKICKTMLHSSMRESLNIAKKKGKPCPAYKNTDFLDTPYADILDEDLKDEIRAFGGLANTGFLTVGPTGSLSILADNCTSGIEPLFKFSYKRKNRVDNKEYEFIHYIACKRMLENFDEFKNLSLQEAKKKLCYVEADEISPEDKISFISAAQLFIESSISNTTNMPNSATVEDIYNLYIDAWKKNLKGVTVFRDGCKDGVLSSTNKKEIKHIPEIFEKELLEVEEATRYRVVWKKNKLYVNVSVDENGEPLEVFTKLPKEAGINGDGIFNPALWQEKTSHWDSICRLISMLLRYSVPVKDIIKQLDRSTYSMVDAAGILKRILSKYIVSDEYAVCPDCGEQAYLFEGGCGICKKCGYSKCS